VALVYWSRKPERDFCERKERERRGRGKHANTRLICAAKHVTYSIPQCCMFAGSIADTNALE
jgi:hypothetical protein